MGVSVFSPAACNFGAAIFFTATIFSGNRSKNRLYGAVMAWEVPGGVGATVRGAFLCLAGFKTGLAAKIGGIFGAANFLRGAAAE